MINGDSEMLLYEGIFLSGLDEVEGKVTGYWLMVNG